MTRKSDRKTDHGRSAHPAFPHEQCRRFRDLLTAFVTNELGEAQSSLVREHLRQCPPCRHIAHQTKRTIDLLRTAGQLPSTTPVKLSDDRRGRIMRAYAQPLLTWFRLYLFPLVGIMVALSLFLALVHALVATWRPQPEPAESNSTTVTLPLTFMDEEPLETVSTNIYPDPASAIVPLIPEPLTSSLDHASSLLSIPPDSE